MAKPTANPLGARLSMAIDHGERPVIDPHAGQIRLHYYGGRVLDHVQVVQVLWGDGVTSDLVTSLPDYYRAILQSPYFDWLGEYDTINVPAAARLGMGASQESRQKIGRGSYLSQVKITPATGTTVTDDQIAAELARQIDMGALPAPQEDGKGGYRTLYMIDFPLGITIMDPTGQQSCQAFCAYHSAGVYHGKNLAYGVHPDLRGGICATGCGNAGTNLGNAGSVHSHELVEATTDPDIGILIKTGGSAVDFPCAWYAESGGEIGDICNAQQGQVASYTVQTEWSNSQGACILQVAGLPACVDGQPGGCSPCTSNSGCPAANPNCDVTAGDLKAGECVQCFDNTQCSGGTPTCDKSATDKNDTCRACGANTDCAAPNPVCITAAGAGQPVGSCVECLTNADCAAGKPVCSPTANTCGGCTKNSDCGDPMNPSCNKSSGACGPDSGGCEIASSGRISGGGLGMFGGTLFGLALILRRRRR